MNRSLRDLRKLSVLMGYVSEKESRQLYKPKLCSLLGLSCDKPYKYRLTNLVTNTVTDWVSVYQLKKMYGINEASFFYHMDINKPIKINGELHTICKIPEDEIENSINEFNNQRLNNIEEEEDEGESEYNVVHKYDSDSDSDNDNGKPKIIFRYEQPNDLIEYDDDGEMIGMRD